MQVCFVEDVAEEEAAASLARLKQVMGLRAECEAHQAHIEHLESNEVLRLAKQNAFLTKENAHLRQLWEANENQIFQQIFQNAALEDQIQEANKNRDEILAAIDVLQLENVDLRDRTIALGEQVQQLLARLRAHQVERANLGRQNQQLIAHVQQLQAQLKGEMDAGSSNSSTSAGGAVG